MCGISKELSGTAKSTVRQKGFSQFVRCTLNCLLSTCLTLIRLWTFELCSPSLSHFSFSCLCLCPCHWVERALLSVLKAPLKQNRPIYKAKKKKRTKKKWNSAKLKINSFDKLRRERREEIFKFLSTFSLLSLSFSPVLQIIKWKLIFCFGSLCKSSPEIHQNFAFDKTWRVRGVGFQSKH